MRLATLMLTAALALGMGISADVLAHDYGARGHGYGHVHRDYPRDVYRPRHVHPRHHGHRYAYRRYYRPNYWPYYRGRHDHDDSWYGIHLFFGGH